jgi:ribosomal-protein-alanine N-acetyltransferase
MRELTAQAPDAVHWETETYQGLFRVGALPRLLLVLEEATQVAAFIIALCCGSEWEIENIAVKSDARRHGLGDRLVGELLARATAGGAEAVFLEVRESNRAARKLYEKKGFLEVGRRPAYYSDPPEDAILYRFALAKTRTGGEVIDSR